jgi:hypothetical protein
MKDKTPDEAVLAKLGRSPVWYKDMKQDLKRIPIGYLLTNEQKYFGLSRQAVRNCWYIR